MRGYSRLPNTPSQQQDDDEFPPGYSPSPSTTSLETPSAGEWKEWRPTSPFPLLLLKRPSSRPVLLIVFVIVMVGLGFVGEAGWKRLEERWEFEGNLNTTSVRVWPEPPVWEDRDLNMVAICSSVKDQVFDLPEWFRHHYYHLGIRHFYIFDDGSEPPIEERLSDFELGIPRTSVTFIYKPRADRDIYQQMHSQNDCLRNYGAQNGHEWMAIIDADEYIEMVKPGESLQGFLRGFGDDVGAVGAQWITHNSHGVLTKPARGSARKTFTTCMVDPDPETHEPEDNGYIKTIARVRDFEQMLSPHSVGSRVPTVGEDGRVLPAPWYQRYPVTRERIAVHHYAVKSRQEYDEKRERGSGMSNHKDDTFWNRVEGTPEVVCDSLANHVSAGKSTRRVPVAFGNLFVDPPPARHSDFGRPCPCDAPPPWIKTATIVSVVVYGATKLGWGAVGFGVALLGVWYTKRSLESLKVDYQEDAVRRGNVVEGGESVEWLNEFVALVWPMLNRELFVAGVDLLEDALKVQSPSIVRTVRIASVDQGSNPMRLLSVRRLPPETPITLPPSLSHPPSSSSTKKSDAKDLDPDAVTDGGGGEVQDGDEPGAYVNIEVEFAYRRPPPSKTKVPNIHFLLYLGVGVKKVAKVDLPVLIELSGVKGKIKLRFQMIPEPPFVRHVTFSFPTLPEIEVSAKPLRSINVMALPVIEPLVLGSVNEVLSEFVAPKSYTIDVSRFVLGSEVDMKTRSCGVVCVVIGRANGLANTDVSGASDPYVTVSFAGVGKVLYSTLVVRNNLDPEWNEIAFLKVSEDEFEEDEKIRLTAFDHDRYSQDDALGCLDIPMKKLQSTPGEFLHSEGALKSPTRTSSKPAQGTLVWRAGFFPLARTTPKIKSYKTNTDDLNPELVDMPEDLITPHKTRKMFTDRSHPEDSRSTQYARRMREMLDGRHPADRGQKTGILAFKVHQIAGLGLSGRKRSLPSSYCAVFLNDEKAFQTRVKPLSSNPYFNAGSEAICPDWLTSTLTVAVMESRDRDHDRILGLVSLDLKDLLSQRCQWTRWYRINQGAGVGRLRLSVLFRPLDIELHHSLLSWSLGTLEVSSIKITGLQTHFEGQVRIATEDWSETAGVEEPEVAATGENSLLVTLPRPIQVPVTDHRRGRLTLTLEEPHSITHNKGKAFASIHVSEIHGLTP
ncbi:hypothetical protein MNV49_000809, partial [Pseudohyphozyma bogoriensis]